MCLVDILCFTFYIQLIVEPNKFYFILILFITTALKIGKQKRNKSRGLELLLMSVNKIKITKVQKPPIKMFKMLSHIY